MPRSRVSDGKLEKWREELFDDDDDDDIYLRPAGMWV
jgi:hypothetical protein